jgi:hypothetical protein
MNKMSNVVTAVSIMLLILLSCGEKERIVEVEKEVPTDCAPSVPRGVYSINYDGFVRICWYPNFEEDIAGYDVYYGEEAYGDYYYIGSVWAVYPDPNEYCYDDTTGNGTQYYYAVSAFDEGGNESDLSYEVVSGTPRPEGIITLYEYRSLPEQSGYDFSGLSSIPQRYDLATTDIYFRADRDLYELTAYRAGVDIQDYGYTGSFDVINWAPLEGWSPARTVEAIYGHCYLMRLDHTPSGYHYAKLYVTEVTANFVTFFWAYQTVPGNRDLAPLPPNGTGEGGTSFEPIRAGGEKVKIKTGFRVGRQLPPSLGEGNREFGDDL